VALRAIAEPHRREILRLVRARELPVVEIAARFPAVSRPAISQHLRVLCDAGLLSMRRSGRNCLYRAREDRIDRLRAYLDVFWGDRLAALKRAAEREARR
jgi:DNA-binding transcriptional ArsR family regulator